MGYDGNIKTVEQPYSEKLILPAEPSKDRYSFLDRFTEKENGTRVNADTIPHPPLTNTAVIYAR